MHRTNRPITATRFGLLMTLLCLTTVPAAADVTLPHVLGSNMVEPAIASGFDSIALDVSAFGAGVYDVTIIAYDYYLNPAALTIADAVTIHQ